MEEVDRKVLLARWIQLVEEDLNLSRGMSRDQWKGKEAQLQEYRRELSRLEQLDHAIDVAQEHADE